MPPSTFDATDAILLRALQANARITVADLANIANLSTSPTWRRLQRLEQVGIIARYQVALDRRSLGWGVLAFINVSLESHSEVDTRAFEQAVTAMPEIIACWSVAGSADFFLQVVGKDLDSFAEFSMNAIRRLPGIKAMQTTFTLTDVKPPTPWPIPKL